ncbi:hypothetical protein [Thermobrachium celere]|uniref:hypothetical protein n=1 Tax=Thermobrachium celere TaxID=53422 RepID=UPI0019427959|nr:hypothetical protein [Thermobrachium celere]GFR35914.1 hypothetical protein TCEA9_17260 [Thermobrachium celere]
MPSNAQIIEKVNELVKLCIDNNYWDSNNEEDNKYKVGKSNIRSVASAVQNAECFEEIKLYIEYKKAKGNGWDVRIGDTTFADKVIRHLNELTEDLNEQEKIKVASKYFGYLYWAIYPHNKN